MSLCASSRESTSAPCQQLATTLRESVFAAHACQRTSGGLTRPPCDCRLTSVGTTHVLNMSNYEGNESKHMPQHFEYLILNMSDSLGIHRHLHGASHFIEEGRSRGSVLVHCTHPKSALSVAAVLAYLMTFQRASLQKASSLVQESFPFCLAQELEEQLLEYQASVLHKPAPDPPHSHVPREASAQTSKIENDDMVIRYQWQPPPESRERAPSRVLRQSYEENRKPPLQDEMLYLSSKESVWHGTDPLLTLAVQNYWTRPATKLSPARNHEQHTICSAQGQGGAESPCLDLSAYTSRTDDLQHQQHALLVATGQVLVPSQSFLCNRI